MIPFLIANILVIIPVIILNYFGVDILNRLEVNWELLTTGLLSLNAPPINPPTYFIRDIFVIFVMIETIRTRNIFLFFGVLIFAWFGELLLRYDILVLFILGVIFSRQQDFFLQRKWRGTTLLILVSAALIYLESTYARHAIAVLLFLLMIDWKAQFINVGGYTYTLHLYHSPIIVVCYPIFLKFTQNPYLLVALQVGAAYIFCYLFYLAIKKFQLGFVIGGR